MSRKMIGVEVSGPTSELLEGLESLVMNVLTAPCDEKTKRAGLKILAGHFKGHNVSLNGCSISMGQSVPPGSAGVSSENVLVEEGADDTDDLDDYEGAVGG